MRLKAPIALSALVVAGLVTTGSSTDGLRSGPDPNTPPALLAAGSVLSDGEQYPGVELTGTVGLVPSTPKPARKLRASTPALQSVFAGGTTLRDVAIPAMLGGLGIPEMVLAAYRNAELALAASEPNCGISWNLLAGIGHIESGHAGGGRTDPAGTTLSPVLGPVLDGSLAGNAVIKAADGAFSRAVGPMQFLPTTWRIYASDGNADGVADPNNVFDAALGAGKYLCSGGLNLRDPAQELRAVLRYNNSMSYAANVLSWSAAYRTGGTPSAVSISPDLIPPGSIDVAALADPAAVTTTTTTTPTTTSETPTTQPTPTEQMINIPGLPPIPCGILCPPSPPTPTPAPAPAQSAPGQPAAPGQPPASGQAQAGPDPAPAQSAPGQPAAPGQPPASGQAQAGPAPAPGPAVANPQPPTGAAAPPPPPPCFIFCPPPAAPAAPAVPAPMPARAP